VEKRPTREDLLPAAADQVRNDDARGLNLKERKVEKVIVVPIILVIHDNKHDNPSRFRCLVFPSTLQSEGLASTLGGCSSPDLASIVIFT
jgi:hypothetical protein